MINIVREKGSITLKWYTRLVSLPSIYSYFDSNHLFVVWRKGTTGLVGHGVLISYQTQKIATVPC